MKSLGEIHFKKKSSIFIFRYFAALVGLAVFACVTSAGFAQGTINRWIITGTVISTLGAGGTFVIGRPYTLQVDFNSNSLDTETNSLWGTYKNPVANLHLNYDSAAYVGEESSPVSEVIVWNDFEELPNTFADLFSLSIDLRSFPPDHGQLIQSFSLWFLNSPEIIGQSPVTPFTTDAFPTALNPSDFRWMSASLRFLDQRGFTSYNDFSVDQIQIVSIPEPRVTVLIMAICAGLACYRWRAKARNKIRTVRFL